jgi:SAM-dependent methyltransferase
MPSLGDNLNVWGTEREWPESGDGWSSWWGGTPAMWHGVLLPRIHGFLPTGTILEIAPGYGRWTQYLKDAAERLVIVDLVEACITRCRERFSTDTNITYHVNDGRSLAMVEDNSIDFAFCFDSLVHAEPAVISGYLEQLAHKLSPDGVGFIHHSNAGALRLLGELSRRLPPELGRGTLMRRGVTLNLQAWRDQQMSAGLFRDQCQRVGLSCVSQELVSWEFGLYLLDCFSLFARRGSRWDRSTRIVRNPMFVSEARRMTQLYAGPSFTQGSTGD